MNKILELIFNLMLENDDFGIISWSTPIPYFGNFNNSKIATLGINPSNREFTDNNNHILKNNRLHSLYSLKINDWSELNQDHLSKILDSCNNYFENNPYSNWFNKLEFLLADTPYSYYFPLSNVCHLDLIPIATEKKWSGLSIDIQKCLLNKCADILGNIVKESKLEYLILNGTTVISNFEKISNVSLNKKLENNWKLKRSNGKDVLGYSFKGKVSKIGNIELNKEVKIIGFNHNIQSSYGISKTVMLDIKDWINSQINN